jgi:hypothetical protein
VDSLAPEGGMEQVLAERVAILSWRLNRVVLYEAERLQQGQEDVIEDLRQERLHKGRIESPDYRVPQEFRDGEPFPLLALIHRSA